jgi:hypothetical protein
MPRPVAIKVAVEPKSSSLRGVLVFLEKSRDDALQFPHLCPSIIFLVSQCVARKPVSFYCIVMARSEFAPSRAVVLYAKLLEDHERVVLRARRRHAIPSYLICILITQE